LGSFGTCRWSSGFEESVAIFDEFAGAGAGVAWAFTVEVAFEVEVAFDDLAD
jgi:hypothetical protein